MWTSSLLAYAVAPPRATCRADCSLQGTCVDGACVCRPGWTGPSCGAADLAPLDPSLGYQNTSLASWGGRPVFDGQRWHLLVTEIKNACPLILFLSNSQVVRAVSVGPDAGGPYIRAETVMPPFHHNPTLIGPTPDGVYLLFLIGKDDAKHELDCRGGVPANATHPDVASNGYITMAWTRDVARGPWQQRVVLRANRPTDNQSSWDCDMENPTAAVLPNGTVSLVYRAHGCGQVGHEALGVATAPHWSAPFVRAAAPIVSPATDHGANNEDAFLWHDPRDADGMSGGASSGGGGGGGGGSWHMLTHQQSKGNVCGSPDAGHSCGAHWFARSALGPWRQSAEPAYTANVILRNGSAAAFQTRQRPQLVFAADGVTPSYLFTGGSFEGNNPDEQMLTHTYAHAFRGA